MGCSVCKGGFRRRRGVLLEILQIFVKVLTMASLVVCLIFLFHRCWTTQFPEVCSFFLTHSVHSKNYWRFAVGYRRAG